ncbi:hypothetical protein CSB20_10065 [bacterium DOLZORAL124_64_63]|nr:MAG: hypothetical protein CSB20_10065 [bacterium DOLZORAL124_64_63]
MLSLRSITLNLLWLLVVALPAQADVILSELCDPRFHYQPDRFIEIHNAGGSAQDLSGWKVVAVGNSANIFTWNLSGTIQPGQTMVCGDATTEDSFPVDFALEAWSDNNSTWNGKTGDGARLINGNGASVDVVVAPGTLFENGTLVRHADVTTGSANYNSAQWTFTAVNNASDATPGSHAGSSGTPPEIYNVWTVPDQPGEFEDFGVKAAVGDDGVIVSVSARYGSDAGNLTNTRSMSLDSGNVYITDAPLPGVGPGESVFFQVLATDDDGNVTSSDVQNVSIAQLVSISAIQGAGETSPYVGLSVSCVGVVTADFGSRWVIQDGTGIRSGLWISGGVAPALGTQVEIQGQVAELDGNTTLTNPEILADSPASVPDAAVITTGQALSEDYEGVLAICQDAICTTYNAAAQYWEVDNGGGNLRVDNMGVTYAPTVGSVYNVQGPLSGSSSFGGIVPRDAADVVFVSDPSGPLLTAAEAQGPGTVILSFSEAVDALSANDPGNFSVTGCSVLSSVRMGSATHRVQLTVSPMAVGSHTVTVDGLSDLFGNPCVEQSLAFDYYGGNVPAGYYDGTEGLTGDDLRAALHDIIDNHNSLSYGALWNAFYTTDDRPDGTVWDMYSDVPGGTPPYVYEFGEDQGGSGSSEGSGYNREHSWPHSWYGGGAPMYTDLFMLYPTDVYVNNRRGNHPFGEVGTATWTSMNGSKLGFCDYPGYSGLVFEPIDEYKGDFARSYFYMSTRYYGEDASWAGSPMVDGSQLRPWAEAMLLEWHHDDPVSQKEIDRNDTVYGFQNNRNPFIDRPDFVARMFGSELSAAPETPVVATILLHQNTPNPFNPATTIRYELDNEGPVQLRVFDLKGRLVRTLVDGRQEAGPHEQLWNGRDRQGQPAPAGVYFYRLRSGEASRTKRMMLVK